MGLPSFRTQNYQEIEDSNLLNRPGSNRLKSKSSSFVSGSNVIEFPLKRTDVRAVPKYNLAPREANLRLARYLYIAKSMAVPSTALPNKAINLIRNLAWLLIAFQILDGILTMVGLGMFGKEAEGNPLVKEAVNLLGIPLGIGLTKLITIMIITSIVVFGHKIVWLSRAMQALVSVYFLFALLPWSILICHTVYTFYL